MPTIAGLVVDVVGNDGWAVLLSNEAIRVVVGVVVALPVSDRGRTPVVGITQVSGNIPPGGLAHIALRSTQGNGHPVRLRGAGQMHHSLGQVQLRFGQAHEFDSPSSGVGHHQRHGVGLAHILAGQDDQTSGDKPGILTGFEHPGQPVEPSIGIRTSDRLDECAHLVVVVVLAVVLET